MLKALPLLLSLSVLFTTSCFASPLHYRLSYSGLITGYLWKELADVTLDLEPKPSTFLEQQAMQLLMTVDTRNHGFAEALNPVRYSRTVTLSPDLQRSLLVRVVDEGANDEEEVYWYNWEKHQIALYHKRGHIDVSIPIFDTEPRLEWEKDRFPPPPKFIDPHPALDNGMSYLLQTKRFHDRLTTDAIDPLAMLMRLRHHDYRAQATLPMQILHEDDLDPYQATLVAVETLRHHGKEMSALKIEVERSSKEGEKGMMTMWLSNDAERIPLRIDIDAPLGMLHVERVDSTND